MTAEELDAELDRARAAVHGRENAAAPTYEELNAAADRAAEKQHQLLTRYDELRQQGKSAELAGIEAEYDAAVAAAQPIYAALAEYDTFDGYDSAYDPAVAAADALEQDRAEEYALHLAEEGLAPDQEHVPELDIE